MTKVIVIKKYRCPKDATSARKMKIIYKDKERLRHKNFPNEILCCPVCSNLYRWKELKELNIVQSIN